MSVGMVSYHPGQESIIGMTIECDTDREAIDLGSMVGATFTLTAIDGRKVHFKAERVHSGIE
jgi:hypothetical protein